MATSVGSSSNAHCQRLHSEGYVAPFLQSLRECICAEQGGEIDQTFIRDMDEAVVAQLLCSAIRSKDQAILKFFEDCIKLNRMTHIIFKVIDDNYNSKEQIAAARVSLTLQRKHYPLLFNTFTTIIDSR